MAFLDEFMYNVLMYAGIGSSSDYISMIVKAVLFLDCGVSSWNGPQDQSSAKIKISGLQSEYGRYKMNNNLEAYAFRLTNFISPSYTTVLGSEITKHIAVL